MGEKTSVHPLIFLRLIKEYSFDQGEVLGKVDNPPAQVFSNLRGIGIFNDLAQLYAGNRPFEAKSLKGIVYECVCHVDCQ